MAIRTGVIQTAVLLTLLIVSLVVAGSLHRETPWRLVSLDREPREYPRLSPRVLDPGGRFLDFE